MRCPNCTKKVMKLVFSPLPVDYPHISICRECLNNKPVKKSTAIHGCDSFTPHYDAQIDVFVESKAHKDSVLKSKGLVQLSGTASPTQKEGRARTKMSRDQYKQAVKRGKV